jgi:protoheme IX farnesyltransferase
MASGAVIERSLVRPGRWAAYLALTKPRIIELLLITTVPAMVLAAGGWPDTWLVIATLAGGALSAGGANALNCYIDRDIDEVMRRTSRRPLPSHAITPLQALVFGIALGVAGFVWLGAFANWLAAAVSTLALLFYVFVYTRWLKRTSIQNIVIGGAAGAAPALVGWAAVTGSLALPAWVLFALVFYWTPPHFWALAIRYRDEYAAADVPMLPVRRGVEATTRQMMLYAGMTVLISLLLVPVASMGWLYLLAAIGLGGWFLGDALRVMRNPQRAMVMFTNSTYYLALIFLAAMVDVLARSIA